jgi:hypothetical protein
MTDFFPVVISIGKIFSPYGDKCKIIINNDIESVEIKCAINETAKPFHGAKLNKEQVQDIIFFLSKCLKGNE